MYQLMKRHFDNVDWDVFQQDLAEKKWVIRLIDDRDRCVNRDFRHK